MKILRIIRKFRKGPARLILPKEKSKRRILNIIKLITNDLKKYGDKCKRGNWILREGKNKYRHIIDPTRPYQLWAGDWKELKIPLLGVTLYIFTIIDCYTRQLMGWELSLIKDPSSAIKAADMAIAKAKKDPLFSLRKLIMHSDQGGLTSRINISSIGGIRGLFCLLPIEESPLKILMLNPFSPY